MYFKYKIYLEIVFMYDLVLIGRTGPLTEMDLTNKHQSHIDSRQSTFSHDSELFNHWSILLSFQYGTKSQPHAFSIPFQTHMKPNGCETLTTVVMFGTWRIVFDNLCSCRSTMLVPMCRNFRSLKRLHLHEYLFISSYYQNGPSIW